MLVNKYLVNLDFSPDVSLQRQSMRIFLSLAGQHRRDKGQHKPVRINTSPSQGQQYSKLHTQIQQPWSTP